MDRRSDRPNGGPTLDRRFITWTVSLDSFESIVTTATVCLDCSTSFSGTSNMTRFNSNRQVSDSSTLGTSCRTRACAGLPAEDPTLGNPVWVTKPAVLQRTPGSFSAGHHVRRFLRIW